jgi:hypothetical protein
MIKQKNCFQANSGEIVHLETRETLGAKNVCKVDALLRVDIKHALLINFLKTLKKYNFLTDVHLLSSKTINIKCEFLFFKVNGFVAS